MPSTLSAPRLAETDLSGTIYCCPKCKRDVEVLLACTSVSCSRCGRAMKRVVVRSSRA